MPENIDDGGQIDQVQADLRQGLEKAQKLIEQTKSLLSGDAPGELA